jgi:transposase InsO family protein
VIELSPEQAAFLEKRNPCFRERHVESGRPGQLLSADTFMVGTLKGIGRVYLHAVVDTLGSYAFGFLHVRKQPEAAVAVLHNDVLPFYQKLDLPVQTILTDNGREFCGSERHAMSSTWRSTTSSTGRQRSARRAPTASSNASTARCWRSSSGRPCAAGSTRASKRSRPTWTLGCTTTITSARTSATATSAAARGRPSSCSSASHPQDKKVKKTG